MAARRVGVSSDVKEYLLNRIISLTETLTDLIEEVSKWEVEDEEVANGNS